MDASASLASGTAAAAASSSAAGKGGTAGSETGAAAAAAAGGGLEAKLAAVCQRLTSGLPLWVVIAAGVALVHPPAFTWLPKVGAAGVLHRGREGRTNSDSDHACLCCGRSV